MDVTARTAILQALRRPSSGQEIVSGLAERSGGRLRLQYGSVYPTLRRLEHEGLVRSWVQRVGRGRPRRNYELTVAGVAEAQRVRDTLRSLISSPSTHLRAVEEMAGGIRGAEAISAVARHLRTARPRR